MNLIQQFPDVSMQMRIQSRSNQKKLRKEKQASQVNASDNTLTMFYENEFRKWHYKLLLIIVFVITSLYCTVFALSALFN